jgi:CRISPR system Cascade subunit CasD
MTTLLLQLVGTMQSWGTHSRYTIRDTGTEPSRSGVVGLLAAALGRPRSADISDLAALTMGVRVDRPGTVDVDYQTVQDIIAADGSPGRSAVTRRYYLADAAFLVGLAGEATLLRHLHAALHSPVWLIGLGRRSYTPSRPIWLRDGLVETDLISALRIYPRLVAGPAMVRYVVDADTVPATGVGAVHTVNDVPVSYATHTMTARRTVTYYAP